jgi:hypothetical protein
MIKKLKKIFNILLNLENIINSTSITNHLKYSAVNSKEIGITNNKESNLIVSLTSYSIRVLEVYLVVESLFNQTLKADKIILWLDENEFSDDTIPNILKKQTERGLEIKYCKNIKSYKKLIPTLKLYPNSTIITVDDDILYPVDFIENFVSSHKKYPNTVLCNIGREIPNDKEKRKFYKNWDYADNFNQPKKEIVPIGAGGVLYPPHCFYKDILIEEKFMNLAPSADDIWFKAMTLKNNVESIVLGDINKYLNKIVILEEAQEIALFNENIRKNDEQIKKVFEEYNLFID